MKRSILIIAISLLSAALGCVPADKGQHYLVSERQIAPEPVYNRVMMARPPEVLPAREVNYEGSPKLLPVIHLELKNVTLETIAQTLAGSARYHSYTAASIAKKKLSIDSLGTIDELANTISNKAGIYVSVDHINREVRFLAASGSEPKLYGQGSEVGNVSK